MKNLIVIPYISHAPFSSVNVDCAPVTINDLITTFFAIAMLIGSIVAMINLRRSVDRDGRITCCCYIGFIVALLSFIGFSVFAVFGKIMGYFPALECILFYLF